MTIKFAFSTAFEKFNVCIPHSSDKPMLKFINAVVSEQTEFIFRV